MVRVDDIAAEHRVAGVRHRVEAVVDIDAPLATVWQVMADGDRYGEWNPFVVRMRGRLAVGERLTLSVRMGWMPARVGEYVEHVDPPDTDGQARLIYRLTGLGPLLGAVRARRIQRLSALGDGATRYTSIELFGGWMSALIPVAAVRRGTQAHAEALSRRARSLANASAQAQ